MGARFIGSVNGSVSALATRAVAAIAAHDSTVRKLRVVIILKVKVTIC